MFFNSSNILLPHYFYLLLLGFLFNVWKFSFTGTCLLCFFPVFSAFFLLSFSLVSIVLPSLFLSSLVSSLLFKTSLTDFLNLSYYIFQFKNVYLILFCIFQYSREILLVLMYFTYISLYLGGILVTVILKLLLC